MPLKTPSLVCLSCESRADVDEMVRIAIATGGSTYNDPQDHGFMYAHGFQDLDGHIWELIYMEPDGSKPRLAVQLQVNHEGTFSIGSLKTN